MIIDCWPGLAAGGAASAGGPGEPRGLPDLLTAYLRGEQRLGRIDPAADIDAAASLIVGAMHGQILPRVLFAPPGTPVTIPTAFPRGSRISCSPVSRRERAAGSHLAGVHQPAPA